MLEEAAPELDFQLIRNAEDAQAVPADAVKGAICWHPPHGVLKRFPQLQIVSSVAAGVDNTLADPELPQVPVCRVIDPNLARGMAEYVAWATLYYHRRFDEVAADRAARSWRTPVQQAAPQTRVGIMGLGVLGNTVADYLANLGFDVTGWARTARDNPAWRTYAGSDALPEFLADRDVVVCLLPLTPLTNGIFNQQTFAAMQPGAAFINCGRGEHLVVPHLLDALDSGHLRGAMLDVFAREPLAQDSPLWSHPKVLVTPHMASSARFEVIVEQVVTNLRRAFAGEAPVNAIDRTRGY